MALDYKTAITALNDNDKNRLLAVYFNSAASTDTSTVNWQKAADDFGSASVDSMRVMVRGAHKKVEKAMAAAGGGVPPTPVKATPVKGGRKRKPAAEEGDDDSEETPKPKAKRGKKAKAKTPTPDADGDNEGGEAVVKGEGADSD